MDASSRVGNDDLESPRPSARAMGCCPPAPHSRPAAASRRDKRYRPRVMNPFALGWRNLVRQKRRTLLMGSVVAFGFAAFALAGGFVFQSFEGLKEGTIRSIGHLQAVDRRAVSGTEQATLEFGLKDAARARAAAAADPAGDAGLPREIGRAHV